MTEFILAIEKLIKERLPHLQVYINHSHNVAYNVIVKDTFGSFVIYDDHLYYYDREFDTNYRKSNWYVRNFDICNPSFDPEIIVEWIKDGTK